MLWKDQRESDNVVDKRGMGGKTLGVGGLVVGAAIVWLLGGNPLLYLAQNVESVSPSQPVALEQEADRKKLVGVVLADTEDVWRVLFRAQGRTYVDPKLILFRDRVRSACGAASQSSGPFYCPADNQVYLDLSFFDELSRSLGVKGDFAIAYVIAHEVGHHVQTLLGLDRILNSSLESRQGRRDGQASVQIELQADCLAGVWAKQTQTTKNVIEPGDIDQAIDAAAAIGDDRLQKRAQGFVVPDSFTHGSSAQRVAAFRRGFAGGELRSCP